MIELKIIIIVVAILGIGVAMSLKLLLQNDEPYISIFLDDWRECNEYATMTKAVCLPKNNCSGTYCQDYIYQCLNGEWFPVQRLEGGVCLDRDPRIESR